MLAGGGGSSFHLFSSYFHAKSVLGSPDIKKLYNGQAHALVYLSNLLLDLAQYDIIISQIS